ncbi:MAG: cell division protein ZapA [Clostridia bacterium]|nr:cell division protein ZapA [Clostridia bacterium]
MRQKYAITVADIEMNIICDESQEVVDKAVSELDRQIATLCSSAGHSCTRTEAALLSALDYSTQCMHLRTRVDELQNFVDNADPTGDSYAANLLRGENEILRAELQVQKGTNDALLQDNATLFQLNAKLTKQNAEANARADRMHDQVLSILTEVRELREKLASLCVDTREPSATYTAEEPKPEVELTPEEVALNQKYSQLDVEGILQDVPKGTVPTPAAEND